MSLYTYPARPVNGGPLEKAYPKVGDWFAEPKYNGWRALVHVPTRTMYNRHGQQLSIASEFKAALDRLTIAADRLEWIDCESLERRHGIGRGTLIVLDLIPEPAYAKTPYTQRREWLKKTGIPQAPIDKTIDNNTVYLTPAWAYGGAESPFGLPAHSELVRYNTLQAINSQLRCEFYEGIVCKKADSVYPIQTTTSNREFPYWVKHRWKF